MPPRDYSAPKTAAFDSKIASLVKESAFQSRFRLQPQTDNDLSEHPLPPCTTSYEVDDRSQPSVSSF